MKSLLTNTIIFKLLIIKVYKLSIHDSISRWFVETVKYLYTVSTYVIYSKRDCAMQLSIDL